jgi:uncharacterized repeat protein (TIGR01451 family)
MSTQNAPRNLSLDRKPADSGPNSSLSKIPIPSIKPFRPRAAVLLVAVLALVLAASLNGVSPRAGLVAAFAENIATFQSNDCSTPKDEWNLGQTACAGVTGAGGERRIVWVAPDGNVADVSAGFTGSGSDTYTLLTTGPFAQYGTWRVLSMDNAGTGYAAASFLVHPTTASVDLQVLKFGPDEAFAGSSISYTIQLTNQGPDTAANVVLSEPVPNSSTFLSEAQNSGPTANCTNPGVGGTGTSTCTIPSLAANTTAIFTFVYTVNSTVPVGTLISNAATVSSSTSELFQSDNTARYQTSVGSTPPPNPCTLTCPSNVSATTTTCTAVVTYATPTTSGNCGTDPVVCSPPSGSAFPIGPTTVTCTTQSGGECSFTVTVTGNDTTPPTITCPSNITTPEDPPSSGAAQVSYATPTATDNCTQDVQVNCSPASGSSFPTGTTTVTCTATDASNNTTTCSFTVTVSAVACALTCPGNVIETATSGCTKVVTYAAPGQVGSCGTVSCDPASGSVFPVGTTTVTCAATDTSGNTITTCSFIVNVTGGTLVCPANITTTENPPGSGSASVNYEEPTACSGAIATCNPPPSDSPGGQPFPVGTTTVNCTTPNSGPTCTFTVTVSSSSCAITCPADKTVNNDPNVCGAVVTFPDPTTAGNCGSDPPTCEPPSGSFFPVGATTVICSSARAGVQCTFRVTVVDNTPPTALCKSITVNLSATSPGTVTVNAADINNGSTDNCAVALLLIDGAASKTFGCANKGPNTVTLTVKDPSNNTATCTATVTVEDNTPPTISCPANIVNEPTCPTGAKAFFSATATDNCPGVTVGCNPASGSVFPIGTTTVTCTATDTSNNTATCTFTVRVKTAVEVIQDLITRVQALQPPLTGQQSQGLVSKLQAALDAINDNKISVACNKLGDFISQVTGFINNGTLTSAQGQPLINSAARVRNTLGCTNLGCS